MHLGQEDKLDKERCAIYEAIFGLRLAPVEVLVGEEEFAIVVVVDDDDDEEDDIAPLTSSFIVIEELSGKTSLASLTTKEIYSSAVANDSTVSGPPVFAWREGVERGPINCGVSSFGREPTPERFFEVGGTGRHAILCGGRGVYFARREICWEVIDVLGRN